MSAEITSFILLGPQSSQIPLVCDSPHSGTIYPDDFGHAIPHAQLRAGEDTHVDQLWSATPDVGAILLMAKFPRTYIDPNRTLNDIDQLLLDEVWPEPLQPTEKSRLGFGLIWRKLNATTPIYDRKLSIAEVRNRIDQYYLPYHAALSSAIEDKVKQFGGVWHLNLHSMPNNAYERLQIKDPPHPLADFVLGDRDGTTCDPEFMDLIEKNIRSMGYSVARNDPYKGMQLIANIGRPKENRHSLQIEIRRPIYMDEITREPSNNFKVVQRDISTLLEKIASYLKEQKLPNITPTQ
jgi:N-formylglutamate deformylase